MQYLQAYTLELEAEVEKLKELNQELQRKQVPDQVTNVAAIVKIKKSCCFQYVLIRSYFVLFWYTDAGGVDGNAKE